MIYTEFVIRIFLSMLLGFLIGLERQLTGHPAGIRINVLICIGTSFFTLFPMLYGSDQVFRVGSSIISGVGFLCSGVIFKDSGTVRGMNTAATLWCTAAIGILASTGMYAIAVTAAGILIASNLILRPLARKLNPIAAGDESEKQYRISVTCQEDAEQEIRLLLINCNPCKTLYLNNLESGGVVGDKVEIVAEYCSLGKPKNQVLEGIVGRRWRCRRLSVQVGRCCKCTTNNSGVPCFFLQPMPYLRLRRLVQRWGLLPCPPPILPI